jgi:hypothetical protein
MYAFYLSAYGNRLLALNMNWWGKARVHAVQYKRYLLYSQFQKKVQLSENVYKVLVWKALLQYQRHIKDIS